MFQRAPNNSLVVEEDSEKGKWRQQKISFKGPAGGIFENNFFFVPSSYQLHHCRLPSLSPRKLPKFQLIS